MLNKLLYCCRSAFDSLFKNSLLSLVTATTISITFIIFLSFLIIIVNLASLKETWVDNIHIVLFFKKEMSKEQMLEKKQEISSREEVDKVLFVTSAEALETLKKSLKGQDGILEGLSYNPLPDTLEIRLKEDILSVEGVTRFVNTVKDDSVFEDIEYGQTWLERFIIFFNILRVFSLTIGVFLFLFSLFIIANTIRLLVYSRREEIEIMKLVGSTDLFIMIPFWIEGACLGLSGAVAALCFMFIAGNVFASRMLTAVQHYFGTHELIFINVPMISIFVFLGILLGFLGSLFALLSIDEFKI